MSQFLVFELQLQFRFVLSNQFLFALLLDLNCYHTIFLYYIYLTNAQTSAFSLNILQGKNFEVFLVSTVLTKLK